MKSKKTHNVSVTYKYAGVLVSVINMYCNGPQYHVVKKSLHKSKKDRSNRIADRLLKNREKIRVENPSLYISQPYSAEAQNKSFVLLLTDDEISMLLTIFNETMKESEHNNYYELELLSAPIFDVRHVYELLLSL